MFLAVEDTSLLFFASYIIAVLQQGIFWEVAGRHVPSNGEMARNMYQIYYVTLAHWQLQQVLSY